MSQNEQDAKGSDAIDNNLKRVFQKTVDEDVPDRFKDLLAQLKAQDESKKSEGNGPS